IGVPLLGFWLDPGLAWTSVLMALAAAGLSYQLGIQRRFVEAVPEGVRGQAFGLLSAGLMSGQAVGGALIGVLGQFAGPGPAIACSGVAGLLVALGLGRVLRPEQAVSAAKLA
ncbi:MAG: MFS transporter, partial [Nonomuraea sp.]|nr:MFS transporter [Nonomuraea sp.]